MKKGLQENNSITLLSSGFFYILEEKNLVFLALKWIILWANIVCQKEVDSIKLKSQVRENYRMCKNVNADSTCLRFSESESCTLV